MTPSKTQDLLISSQRDLAFHHIGVACERIDDEVTVWEALGYRAPEGEPFIDVEQGIRGLFMVGSGPRIELLEAYGGSGTLAPWIKRRVKLYHLGFLAHEFDAALAKLLSGGAKTTREPVNSSYFKSRIAFATLPNLTLIELIEASQANGEAPQEVRP